MFIEILFKIVLLKGGVLIYAEHCMYVYIYIYIYICISKIEYCEKLLSFVKVTFYILDCTVKYNISNVFCFNFDD